jgi:predicted neuraminidase
MLIKVPNRLFSEVHSISHMMTNSAHLGAVCEPQTVSYGAADAVANAHWLTISATLILLYKKQDGSFVIGAWGCWTRMCMVLS